MEPIEINSTLKVGVAPETVIITTTDACKEDGEIFECEVFLVLDAPVAIKLAHAILHAAANVPEEDFSRVPGDLFLEDGSLNPAYAE